MSDVDSFYEALDEAIVRSGNINRLSRYTGIPFQTLSRWASKTSNPTLEGIVKLLPFIDWPKRRKSPPAPLIQRMDPNAPAEIVQGDDLVKIPVMLQAGAGKAVDVWESEPSRWIDVLPRYAKKNTRAVEVVGDSMEPTIRNGAIVGVEPFSGEFRDGGIYLCRLPYFGLVVKRVHMDGLNGITLLSDNAAYQDMHIPFEGCENLIIGRVVWYWQEA